MKPRKKLLTAIAGCLMLSSAFPMAADDSGKKKNTPTVTPVIVSNKKSVSSFRPKAPSRQSIECLYSDDGILYIDFFIPEGDCTMTVTDAVTGFSLQYQFHTEESAEIFVGPLFQACFEFDTEAGNSYEGYLSE